MTRNNSKEYEMHEYEVKNVTTGQVISTPKVEAKPGTQVSMKITTEGQRESYKHKMELNEAMKEFIEKNEGAFIHLMFKYGATIFKELQEKAPGNKCNIHIIRFIVLATYSTFHGTLSNNSHRIKKSNLKTIWDTSSKNSINETYNLLMDCGYVYETEEGFLMINEDMIIKGSIIDLINELRKQDPDYTCVRIFTDNVKEIYYGTEPKQRKILANLFKILPYVNFKFNVFCSNPEETDEAKLKLLNWTDLARICEYDINNVSKFKKELMNLKVYGNDVIGEFNRSTGKTIIVNPRIYYGGDDISDVDYLYKLFKMVPKK